MTATFHYWLTVVGWCERCRLMRELDKLRQAADYTSCDCTGLAGWLYDIMPELRRYTYQMLKAGITLPVLPQLSNRHLLRDCKINNGIHRLLISEAAKRKCQVSLDSCSACHI